MKYMLMMHAPGNGPLQIASWPADDIKAHIAFMATRSTRSLRMRARDASVRTT